MDESRADAGEKLLRALMTRFGADNVAAIYHVAPTLPGTPPGWEITITTPLALHVYYGPTLDYVSRIALNVIGVIDG